MSALPFHGVHRFVGATQGRIDVGVIASHEADIVKLEAKLREAAAKQKTMQARAQSATSAIRIRKQVSDRRIDDAFTRFEKMEKRIDSLEGEAESYNLGTGKSLADEIADLETDGRVEAELNELKAKLRGARAPTLKA